MEIGLQLYTLRDFAKTPKDVAETLKKVAKIGYRVVQISGICPIDARELKKILDDNELYACSYHIGYEEALKKTQKIIDNHHILGAGYPVVPGLPIDLHNADGYRKVAKELSRIGEIMNREKLILSYHNHALELVDYGGKKGLEILFEESSPQFLQTEIDTYWIQYGGGDPAQWIERFPNRAPLVHFKDMGITRENKPVMVPIGEGNLNWKAIMKACVKSGSKYVLVEMDESPLYPIWESVERSFKNMKTWMT